MAIQANASNESYLDNLNKAGQIVQLVEKYESLGLTRFADLYRELYKCYKVRLKRMKASLKKERAASAPTPTAMTSN